MIARLTVGRGPARQEQVKWLAGSPTTKDNPLPDGEMVKIGVKKWHFISDHGEKRLRRSWDCGGVTFR